MKLFISIIGISIILINFYIFQSTKKMVKNYSQNPPFAMIDYTKSHQLNSLSHLLNLRDQDSKTVWIKEREGREWDFELELKLSHIYSEGKFLPRKFNTVQIQFCKAQSFIETDHINVQLFQREAINVDKVLRLPDDFAKGNFDRKLTDNLTIDISNVLDFRPTKEFPNEIYIVGIRGKLYTRNKICLSDVSIE